jgi:hypothetical protein
MSLVEKLHAIQPDEGWMSVSENPIYNIRDKSMTSIRANRIQPRDPQKRAHRGGRMSQPSYMRTPSSEHVFDVGDTVEVYCDHEKVDGRVRGWLRGIVVQVDNKMVAVQFRTNVFLTDGWMVPDRILWYPSNSEHIRSAPQKKTRA